MDGIWFRPKIILKIPKVTKNVFLLTGRGRVRQDPGPEAEGSQGGQGTEEEEVGFAQGEQELGQVHLDHRRRRLQCIDARLLSKKENKKGKTQITIINSLTSNDSRSKKNNAT